MLTYFIRKVSIGALKFIKHTNKLTETYMNTIIYHVHLLEKIYCKNVVLTFFKIIYSVNIILMKMSMSISREAERILKFEWNHSEKMNKIRDIGLLNFETYYKMIVIKTILV